MPKQATVSPERAELPPKRVAALRKWLHVANSRLLSLQRERQQLLATARSLANGLGQRSRRSEAKRPKLAARLAKVG
jgi:hypothetical protein